MRAHRSILLVALAIAVGYVWLRGGFVGVWPASASAPDAAAAIEAVAGAPRDGLSRAVFAAGCFWCTEADFDKVAGVVSTTSGYTGGRVANPSYKAVSAGTTGHTEAVLVEFDLAVVTYNQLLDLYWRNVDPFVAHRQFCDVGSQYRPEIFVFDDQQRAAAEASRARVQSRFQEAVLVKITEAGPFYAAEEYHQDYYRKNSAQYRFYRYGCGRDARLRSIWGDGDS